MQLPSFLNPTLSICLALLGGIVVFLFRLRASNRPVKLASIIMPPIGMSTGFLMFIVPDTHIPLLWALGSLLVGALLFSYPLIRTSKFQIVEDKVYMQQSKMFFVFVAVLLAVRVVLHDVVERYVTILQSGALFYLLAFGMIVPWRLFMLRDYLALQTKRQEQS
ncbi:CcdC family protein [Paenibacillus turpanensis]|uniref:CcdC family protein n=1 Tax=Paenibacillus turpanensis TaxID=2689078 RepID=UPI00140D49B6|nr:cytochrome c biogenesis protein CcdC [Paenibacillus turpanensis]